LVVSCAKNELVTPAGSATEDAATGKSSSYRTTAAFSYALFSPRPEPLTDVKGYSYLTSYPWALGQSQVIGGHTLYRWNDISGVFVAFPGPNSTSGGLPGNNIGGVVKFALGQNFNPTDNERPDAIYAVTNQNKLYACFDGRGSRWIDTGQLATDVAIARNRPNARYSEAVYFLGAANVYGGHPIYKLDVMPLVNNQWSFSSREVVAGAAATSIAVEDQQRLWCVNSLNEIFVNTAPLQGGTFDIVDGKATSIATDGSTVAVTGTVFLNHGYEIFLRDRTAPYTIPGSGFHLQSGDATQIGDGMTGEFWVNNDLGEVFSATY
jgi:hypothetical protein